MTSSNHHRFAVVLVAYVSGCGDDLTLRLEGTSTRTHITAQETVSVPEDLSTQTVAAHAVRSDGWSVYPGEGFSDGRFEISSVPTTELVLQIGREFYALDSHLIADGLEVIRIRGGRPDATRSYEAATTLALTHDDLSPWADDDDLVLFSAGAGCNFRVDDILPVPIGATSLDGTLTYDRVPGGGPLIESSKGDDAHLLQMRTEVTELGKEIRVIRIGEFSVDQTPGGDESATVLPEIDLLQISRDLDLDARAFVLPLDALAADYVGPFATLYASARRGDQQTSTPAAWLYTLVPGSLNEVTRIRAAVSTPFPEEWHWWEYGAEYAVRLALEGSFPTFFYGGMYVRQDASTGDVVPAPTLRLPFVTIDGEEISSVTDVSPFPQVEIGTVPADIYWVDVYRMFETSDGFTDEQWVARLVSSKQAIPTPPGILIVGERYVMRVSTYVDLSDGTSVVTTLVSPLLEAAE